MINIFKYTLQVDSYSVNVRWEKPLDIAPFYFHL